MPVDVINGDCRDAMRGFADATFAAIVTDPPYELTAARPGGRSEATRGAVMGGFMGMRWDATGAAFDVDLWREALRVLKPGGHLLAFGGTRTYHRMACAIEDAGFEIRDQIQWLYGSGFPKSRNLEAEWEGWGTALKPAHEPIVLARKPLVGTVAENVAAHGCGALNIDAARIECEPIQTSRNTALGRMNDDAWQPQPGMVFESHPKGRWPANIVHDGSDEVIERFPAEAGASAPVRGTEPSALTDGIYGARDRVPGAFHGDTGSAARFFYCAKASREDRDEGCDAFDKRPLLWSAGTQNPGSFQSPNTEREARNFHPTVKPTALMRWLVRLVTPPGGRVLDCFAGSGSTGKACELEGFDCTLIEGEADYLPIIHARLAFAREERRIATAQQELFA